MAELEDLFLTPLSLLPCEVHRLLPFAEAKENMEYRLNADGSLRWYSLPLGTAVSAQEAPVGLSVMHPLIAADEKHKFPDSRLRYGCLKFQKGLNLEDFGLGCIMDKNEYYLEYPGKKSSTKRRESAQKGLHFSIFPTQEMTLSAFFSIFESLGAHGTVCQMVASGEQSGLQLDDYEFSDVRIRSLFVIMDAFFQQADNATDKVRAIDILGWIANEQPTSKDLVTDIWRSRFVFSALSRFQPKAEDEGYYPFISDVLSFIGHYYVDWDEQDFVNSTPFHDSWR